MDFFQTTINLLILVCVAYILAARRPTFSFNPFVSGPMQGIERLLDYFRSALRIPNILIGLLLIALLLTISTMLPYRTGRPPELDLAAGNLFVFHAGEAAGLSGYWHVSLLKTLLFFIRLWSVFFIVNLITPRERTTRAFDAYTFYAAPFSRLPILSQGIALLLAAFLIAFAAIHTLQPNPPDAALAETLGAGGITGLFTDASLPIRILRFVWLSLLVIIDSLRIINQALLALLIGNLVCALFQWQVGGLLCMEGVYMLLGRFARKSPSAGGIDLTPLIFMILVNMLHVAFVQTLTSLIIAFKTFTLMPK